MENQIHPSIHNDSWVAKKRPRDSIHRDGAESSRHNAKRLPVHNIQSYRANKQGKQSGESGEGKTNRHTVKYCKLEKNKLAYGYIYGESEGERENIIGRYFSDYFRYLFQIYIVQLSH